MGRRIDPGRTDAILKTVQENDGKLQAAGIAKKLNLHPQAVVRILTALEEKPEKQLCEDDNGFLSIFKGRR